MVVAAAAAAATDDNDDDDDDMNVTPGGLYRRNERRSHQI